MQFTRLNLFCGTGKEEKNAYTKLLANNHIYWFITLLSSLDVTFSELDLPPSSFYFNYSKYLKAIFKTASLERMAKI